MSELSAYSRAEVLAPCGSPECAVAAVHGGADAVYLGYGDFNARRNARNFTLPELKETVSYCHAHGVAVHVALNTVVFPDELPSALKTAEEAAEAGADAFIVQDMGLARLIKNALPHIPLHASTQCSVHSLEGAKELARAGFKRIVLARELSEREIAEIRQGLPDSIELEAFVHGALCMSVSGQCYFSALLGGRSGNRGLCAQTCRLPFSCRGRQNALSLKDLSLTPYIRQILSAGVTSLKIEGRMKRPEYVAIACYNVRRGVDGLPCEEEAVSLLRDVFSRSGFTDGYFTSNRGEDMFGVRSKEDSNRSERVFQRINELTRYVYPRLPLDMAFTAKAGEQISLTVTDLKAGNAVTVYGNEPRVAQKPSDSGRVRECLEKLGGTACYAGSISVDLPSHLFVPVSEVNGMRREAVAKLMGARTEIQKLPPLPVPPLRKGGHMAEEADIIYEIRAERVDLLPRSIPPHSRVILPMYSLNGSDVQMLTAAENEVCAELPRLIFGVSAERAAAEKLAKLREAGVKYALCSNIGHIALIKKAGLIPIGGVGLNITNGASAEFYSSLGVKEQTVSFELSLPRIAGFSDSRTGAAVYGRLPVMLTRNCPLSGKNGCKDCRSRGEGGVLTDRMGEEFPVLCRKGYGEIYNSRPLYMGDKQKDLLKAGVTRFLLCFTDETAEQATYVTELFMSGQEFPRKFTRGLYLK